MRALSLVVGVAVLGACIESPQSRMAYPAVFVPSTARTASSGDWQVTLSRAEIAFGPAYFCAAASGSSTLCGTAIAEVRAVTRLDALSSSPVSLGQVDALTGAVRSVSYDLGLLWLDTQQDVTPEPEAPEGHSAVLEGEAVKGEMHLPFVVHLDVPPQYQGQHAIATAPATADIASDAYVLEVHVDPVRWLSQVNFDAAAERPERPLVFDVGSQEHSAVVVGLKTLAPFEFRWVPTQR